LRRGVLCPPAALFAMNAKTVSIFKNIKSLKVQGAENVASAAVDALALDAFSSKAAGRKAFLLGLGKTAAFLKTARPTEPALRNALRFIVLKANTSKEESVAALRTLVADQARQYHENSLQTKLKIAEYGAKLVPAGGTVLVHCHSSLWPKPLRLSTTHAQFG